MANLSNQLNTTFHALSDPTRRAVIGNLVEGSASVSKLSEQSELRLPAFLKHLKVLEESGLIATEKVGRVRTCTLKIDRLQEVETWLMKYRKMWELRLNKFSEYVESLEEKKQK